MIVKKPKQNLSLVKMTDSSDCESDAGASPSVSSEESSNSSSSRSSSPSFIKTSPDNYLPSTKKKSNTLAESSSSSTPNVSVRKPMRRRQSSNVGNNANKLTKGAQSQSSQETDTSNSNIEATPTRKRKRSPKTLVKVKAEEDLNHSINTNRKCRHKKRRTRSERNLLAGKTGASPAKCQSCTEHEDAEAVVALDAEIDKVLEEKAIKNNLSATNVKSIIHHVITNNMVQKMIMSAVLKQAEAAEAGGSSDDCGLLEPKMTRAKTKELMESNKQSSLWPTIVESPVKKKHPLSETHMLIHHELPEDSSDEEYVPKENDMDLNEANHSDDESSLASLNNSPASAKQGVKTRSSLLAETEKASQQNNLIFKTPPPKPKSSSRRIEEASAISRRTRSKLQLHDTPLEDLERQLVPPDVTNDMYDWGTATDNEDYLAFLNEFLNPGLLKENDANEIDDEADPEYNVMEDDEDVHDREELRMDRAVKVPKKELTQLIAELFEPGLLSGDDDDHDLTSLTGFTPLVNDSGFSEDGRQVVGNILGQDALTMGNSAAVPANPVTTSDLITESPIFYTPVEEELTNSNSLTQDQGKDTLIAPEVNINQIKEEIQPILPEEVKVPPLSKPQTPPPPTPKEPLFRECDIVLLQQQMRQHIQLVTQSYVLTVSSEDPGLKNIAAQSKVLINSLRASSKVAPARIISNFQVCNLDTAWTIVNFWPHKFLQQSPIKKKILEERYISEYGVSSSSETASGCGRNFPRHVVKVLLENPTFIYEHLLPECFSQKNRQQRCYFSKGEDKLLVSAMEDFNLCDKEREDKKTTPTSEMSHEIAQVLLVTHSRQQIFNRIRNLRKIKGKDYPASPEIKKYFEDGILPEVDRSVMPLTEEHKQPIIDRTSRNLSPFWSCLLQHFLESSTYRWDVALSMDPVTKSFSEKWNKKKKTGKDQSKSNKDAASSSHRPRGIQEQIMNVFPLGTLELEKPRPDMEAIPLIGANGKTGAMVYIPKYALPQKPEPEVVPLQFVKNEPSPSVDPLPPVVQNFGMEGSPREAEEAGEQPLNQEVAQSVTGMETEAWGQTTQVTLKPPYYTPLKRMWDPPIAEIPTVQEQSATVVNAVKAVKIEQEENQIYSLPTVNYTLPPQFKVIEVIGQPFMLPELMSTMNASSGTGPVVVNLATLQSPLKKLVLDKVAEQQSKVIEESETILPTIKEEDEESTHSSNVILEGTEVELSSDDEVDDIDQQHSPPETIDLISDDEAEVIPVPKLVGEGSGDSGNEKTAPSEKVQPSQSNQQNVGPISASAVSSTTGTLGISSTGGAHGNGDDSEEDGERRPNSRKRPLPKDYDGDSESVKDEDCSNSVENDNDRSRKLQAESSIVSSSSHVTSSAVRPTAFSPPMQQSGIKPQKRGKRSPGTQCSQKRVSKYPVTPAEQMVEDEPDAHEEIVDAYTQTLLMKTQAVTEAKHPGLYNTLVQTLLDTCDKYGENTDQLKLFAKVKVLLKDYPELLREFEGFFNKNSSQASSANDDVMAELTFLQKLEKFTENAPQLRSKIINKVKSLKEANPNVTEKELARSLEPFFFGNRVMMAAFKELLPSVYRPHSLSSGMDFEVVELDLEDPPRDIHDDGQFEILKLPEETAVPATSTCPCACHVKTKDPAFSSRSKHCKQCSIKFQDGKIYIHNGRVMRPVSVELTPASASPKQSPNTRTRKDSAHSLGPNHSKAKEFKEPETKQCDKKSATVLPQLSPVASTSVAVATTSVQPQIQAPLVVPSSLSSPNPKSACSSTAVKPNIVEGPVATVTLPKANEDCASDDTNVKLETVKEEVLTQEKIDCDDDDDWTEEEDRIILSSCQEEPSLDVAWRKMAAKIPSRSMEQLKSRLSELIALINIAEAEGSE